MAYMGGAFGPSSAPAKARGPGRPRKREGMGIDEACEAIADLLHESMVQHRREGLAELERNDPAFAAKLRPVFERYDATRRDGFSTAEIKRVYRRLFGPRSSLTERRRVVLRIVHEAFGPEVATGLANVAESSSKTPH